MTNPSKFMKDFKEFLDTPTDDELNKRIHEILGMCLHETRRNGFYTNVWVCNKCKENFEFSGTLDFTTSWEGFGILWGFMQKHEKFEVFFSKILFDGIASGKRTISQIVAELLSPLALTQATVEFFKEEQK